ncbi:hypothetical protein BHE74_00031146 [Ensete ventricosum]|nr:hypothetical protein BHE74_00031146 [Ensete ventricosum]
MPSTLAHRTCRAMPFVLERQRCAMPAVAGEPLTAPHLAGAHLGWAIRGARGLEKTEGEASEVLEVLEVGLAPRTRPAAEGLFMESFWGDDQLSRSPSKGPWVVEQSLVFGGV